MIEKELTQELLEQLTPRQISERFGLAEREVEVLRKRFGIVEKTKDDPPIPPNGGEDNGSGGVPAPADDSYGNTADETVLNPNVCYLESQV